MTKLWGGRFTKETNTLVDAYTASIGFDWLLWEQDIKGSLAHVKMLGEEGILSPTESLQIQQGLEKIAKKIKNGEIHFSIANEDIHMNIEKALIDEIGDVGGKLHTGRSRNDQVATDMHLYVREKTKEIIELINACQKAILTLAKDNVTTIFPGYTHLQRAQPLSFAHHMMTYFWMLQRDKERFEESLKRLAFCPLGAGALAGTTFSINRQRTAELLGFYAPYPNSIDAVSNRDFSLELVSNSSILMMHLSRLAEELILWSSTEFQFIELDDAFCTGSSMMPQKKNPDVPELIRGKSGRVVGHFMALLTVLKGLPLAYNKDLQEDKEGVFDTIATIIPTLTLLTPLIETMKVNREKMKNAVTEDYSNATDLADYLVGLGIPFREAHELVGKTVLYAIEKKKYLGELSLNEFQYFHSKITEEVYHILQPEQVMNARKSEGGTAIYQVREQIVLAEKLIN